jgi:hypothetical protein
LSMVAMVARRGWGLVGGEEGVEEPTVVLVLKTAVFRPSGVRV